MSESKSNQKIVLEEIEMKRILTRIAHEIIERNEGLKGIALIGIRTGGVFLAHRLADRLAKIEGEKIEVGELDITLYRDDFSSMKESKKLSRTTIPFNISNKKIIIVDDVLFTGRTIRAAMDELIDFGRPSEIQLAVLIDRGHRELPIKATYIGKSLPTARIESVKVMLKEYDSTDRVIIGNVS